MAVVNIGGKINLGSTTPNIDNKYGPYLSLNDAWDALGPDGDDVACVGLTVGIKNQDKIVEYWFKDAADSKEDLVVKFIDSTYHDATKQDVLTQADKQAIADLKDISNKVDKVAGKSLLADTEITRLGTLANYDDTEVRNLIAGKQDTLTQQDKQAIADLKDISGKQDVISDLATIRSGAALGATAIQEHQSLAAYRTASQQDAIDASKQDTISDLDNIRSGASKGATAIQEHQSLAAYRKAEDQDKLHDSTKQDVISDLATIRSGAELGATALQQHQSLAAYRTAEDQDKLHDSTKQDVISDLVAIRNGAALGATSVQDVSNKVDKVNGKGLSTNDLTDNLKTNYDAAYTHSQSTHARTDATKTEASTTNGYIKINGTETKVYSEVANTVHDANYKHISVTETSVSDGTNTFNANTAGSGIAINNKAISITYSDSCTIATDAWQAVTEEIEEETVTKYWEALVNNLTGITAESHPTLDILITKDQYADIDTLNEAWSKIFSAETIENGIHFYAKEKPEKDLTIQIKGY